MNRNIMNIVVLILLTILCLKTPTYFLDTKVIENNNDLNNLQNENEIEREEMVLETIIGRVAAYGPDCKGCCGKTASGYNIKNGNILYNDSEYGSVRVLAGDKSYPFGTIVKITGVPYFEEEYIYGIVLDRGGGIGKDKKFLFDILVSSEKESSSVGSPKNIKFEILRYGY